MGPDRETVAGLAAGILARVRLHSSESEERGDEIDECGEAPISLLIAGCDPTKRLEIAEEVFDQMAPRLALGGMTAAAPRSFSSARSLSLSNALSPDQSFELHPGDQAGDGDTVMTLAGQKDEANKIAERIDEHHDLSPHFSHLTGASGLRIGESFSATKT